MADQVAPSRIKAVLLRAAFAVLAFGFLSMYVWAAQKAHDRTESEFLKLMLYSLIILGAGLTYDCGKALLLMPASRFAELFRTSIFPAALMALVMAATGILTVMFVMIGWPMSAIFTYVGGLSFLLFGINMPASKKITSNAEPAARA